MEEKIGQLLIVGIKGTTITDEDKEFLNKVQPGGIIIFEPNVKDRKQLKKFVADIKKSLKVKPFISIDQEGGAVDRLRKFAPTIPSMWGLNKLGVKKVLDAHKIIISELKDLGINLNHTPVLDINSNKANPVIGNRSISHLQEEVSQVGSKLITQYSKSNIISSPKHFPGHGDLKTDSHHDLPTLNKSLNELEKNELAPFKDAIKAKAPMIMVGHIKTPFLDKEKPASVSKKIISDLLIKKLKFKGLVVTDDLTMGAISKSYSLEEACYEAHSAGADLSILASNSYIEMNDYYEVIYDVIENLKYEYKNSKKFKLRVDNSYKKISAFKKKALKQTKTRSNIASNSKKALALTKEVVHFSKKDLLFTPLSKAKSIDSIYPNSPKLRKIDLELIVKNLKLKNIRFIEYNLDPSSEDIENTIDSIRKSSRKIIITYDIATRKKQRDLTGCIHRDNPDASVISVGLEHDIEFLPFIKTHICAYAPNYNSLFCALKMLNKR